MRNSAQEMLTEKNARMLRQRREAEAAADAREEQIRPSDRTGFYLRQLQTVLSHLVDIATGIGGARGWFEFAGWDLFVYADVAIGRAEEGNRLPQQDEQWMRLWGSLKLGLISLERWAGDGQKASQLAKVMFVSAFVLRGAYEVGSECQRTGEERGFEFCANEVPFPIAVTLPLPEQLQFASRNLDWLHEQLRCDVVWPRWW